MSLKKEAKEAEDWFNSRPPKVKEAFQKYPPDACYRVEGQPNGHYHLVSYDEDKDGEVRTVTVNHLSDSFLHGFQVFGVDINSLRKCGCRVNGGNS